MADADVIIIAIAALGRVAPERVTPDARLGDLGIGSSIAIGMLQSRLRAATGRAPADLSWKTTVAELRAALADSVRAAAPAQAARSSTPPASRPAFTAEPPRIVGVGLDLEDVASLPPAGDSFYADHFTPAELSAAATKEDARRHLCGVWCAKEAAKKAVAALHALPATAIEVTTDGAGRPSMRVIGAAGSAALPRLEVSITHTATTAAAVVVALA